MNHKDLMKVLSDFVRYYPLPADPLDECQRLNCFAMLEDSSQVLDSNMGKNIYETDFFFFQGLGRYGKTWGSGNY